MSSMTDTTTVSRRRAIAMLVTAPLALVTLPAALEAAPLAPSAADIGAPERAACDAILDAPRGLADLAGQLHRRAFGTAWLYGLLVVAAARDAYVAEHGAWARPIWDDVVGEYLRLMRRFVDEAKARHAGTA